MAASTSSSSSQSPDPEKYRCDDKVLTMSFQQKIAPSIKQDSISAEVEKGVQPDVKEKVGNMNEGEEDPGLVSDLHPYVSISPSPRSVSPHIPYSSLYTDSYLS
jgi:hypothetical protein